MRSVLRNGLQIKTGRGFKAAQFPESMTALGDLVQDEMKMTLPPVDFHENL
jgi:hypothetical protein